MNHYNSIAENLGHCPAIISGDISAINTSDVEGLQYLSFAGPYGGVADIRVIWVAN